MADPVNRSRETYDKLRDPAPPLAYGEWVEAGCPTGGAALAAEAERSRRRVLESLARLPALQDELGRHSDELSAPARRCGVCGGLLEAVRVETAWVLPLHAGPEQHETCRGTYSPGDAP